MMTDEKGLNNKKEGDHKLLGYFGFLLALLVL